MSMFGRVRSAESSLDVRPERVLLGHGVAASASSASIDSGATFGTLATPPAQTRPGPASVLRVSSIAYGKLTWVHLDRPGPREIDWLRSNYPFFHPLDLEDCMSKVQRPKIDEYDDYMFIVLHFPVFSRQHRVTSPSEINVFIGANYVITVQKNELQPLERAISEVRESEARRAEMMGRSSGFLLYKLIERLVEYCFPILNRIASNIDAAEESVFEQEIRDGIRLLAGIRRDVIAFRRIIRPQMAIIASLEHKDRPFLREDLDVYWSNISDQVNRIWDILDDQRDVVEGLVATSESMNALRTNEVMKVLTLISTIMLPMAVISGIYGMNIAVLPMADTEYSFLVTVGTMLCVLVGMLTFFRIKRWI